MAGVAIDVRIEDWGVQQAFTQLITIMGNTTPVMAAIGEGLVSSTHRRFVAQKSPDGMKWAPLHPAYRAIKRNSRILTESGRLRGSINAQASNDMVRVGTNVIYAAIHQFGGTIVPRSARFLFFRLSSGLVQASSVTLPARPFMGISSEDEEMIADTVFGFVSRRAR